MTQEKRRDPKTNDDREQTWESEGGRQARPDEEQDPSTQRKPHPDPDSRTQSPMKKK